MKRDHRAVIAALIRKANDRATPAPERDALLAKVAELRDAHPEPEPQPVRGLFDGPRTGTTTATVGGYVMTVTFGVAEWR